MRYRNTIIALSFIVIIASTPLLGIPQSWKQVLIIASAVAVATLAYLAGKARS
ncbi:MAG: hypothetical protein Q8L64_05980 [bacterium]|nr:hypothetical protein [bacterium]